LKVKTAYAAQKLAILVDCAVLPASCYARMEFNLQCFMSNPSRGVNI